MINLETFTAEHIRKIQEDRQRDPALIERTIYALGLLEALARSELPFIFKGGTALLLLLNEPRRFSTDIDIVVNPGVDLESFLEITATIWPFINMSEQVRNVVANIEKRHFKFTYASPLTGKDQTILLDILFEENPYSSTLKMSIETELLITEQPSVMVTVPNVNCIIADKLTAFAPHTTGIPYHVDKELEIVKQLYDIAAMINHIDNFNELKSNYFHIAETEFKYRSLNGTPKDSLRDTINTAICIAGRGKFNPEEYLLLKRGIGNIRNHIYSESFNGEVAVQRACMVMYLAMAILTEQESLPEFKDDEYYLVPNLINNEYKGLNSIRKTDMLAYKYLIEAFAMFP